MAKRKDLREQAPNEKPVADFSGTITVSSGGTEGTDTLGINGVIGSVALVIPDLSGKTLTLQMVDGDGVPRREYPSSIADNTTVSDPARVLVDAWMARREDELKVIVNSAVSADTDIDYYGRLT